MNLELIEKFITKAAKFANNNDWEVIYSTPEEGFINVVAADKDGVLHVIWVTARNDEDQYNYRDADRLQIELEFVQWWKTHDPMVNIEGGNRIFFDKCEFTVMNSKTAFLKYSHDYTGGYEN